MSGAARRLVVSASKYVAIARINLLNNLAYMGEMLSRSIFMVVILYIFISLWRATYREAGTSSIDGLTFRELLWYFVITESIVLSKLNFASRISDEVRDGSLAYTLGRPCNYLLYHFAYGLGDSALRLVINFFAGSAIVWLLAGPPVISLFSIPCILVTIVCAFILDFCIEGIIGLSAFITEDATSMQMIYRKILFIFGGLWFPLDFFPGWLKSIALALPFNYIIYGPAKISVQFSLDRWLHLVAMQLLWSLVFALILAVLFQIGRRHLTINGG
jgi:ABC-2 type transport system permease protein